MYQKSNKNGFTLLELLLGLAITALVAAMLFAVLRLGHRAEQKGQQRSEISQTERIISSRLGFLLRGAFPYVVKDEEGQLGVLLTALLAEGGRAIDVTVREPGLDMLIRDFVLEKRAA